MKIKVTFKDVLSARAGKTKNRIQVIVTKILTWLRKKE